MNARKQYILIFKETVACLFYNTILVFDFRDDGKFDAKIGDKFLTSCNSDQLLAKTIWKVPNWTNNTKLDRLYLHCTKGLIFPREDPLAISAASRGNTAIVHSCPDNYRILLFF